MKWDFHIPEPCDQDWDSMEGDERQRFCNKCQSQVHDLSQLTEEKVHALMDRAELPCVQVLMWPDGTIEVQEKVAALQRQRQGLRRLAVSAAVAVPLLAAVGCDDPALVAESIPVSISAQEELRTEQSPSEQSAPTDPLSMDRVDPAPEQDVDGEAVQKAAAVEDRARDVAAAADLEKQRVLDQDRKPRRLAGRPMRRDSEAPAESAHDVVDLF